MDLYVPVGVKNKKELISGFGRAEIIDAVRMMCFGGVLMIAEFLSGCDGMVIVITLIASSSASVIFCRRNPETRLSAMGMMKMIFRYYTTQQIYPYRYLNEFEIRGDKKR